MASPTVNHRGHAIVFYEATEEWTCGSLALADKSLSSLKATIDRESKKRRRVNVDAYHLGERYRTGGYVHTVRKVVIVLLREGDRKADIKVPGESGQEQVDLGELYSLDQKPLLDAFISAKNAQAKAEQDSRDIEEKLTHMTGESVREAVAQAADAGA